MKKLAPALLLLLAGCATHSADQYRSLDGRSDEARMRAFSQCSAEATPYTGGGLVGVGQHYSYIKDCMRAQGYERAP